MNPAPYTEDILVQQTTADYLEQQLGWESIYAYNSEDFSSDSLLGRTSDREVVLTRHLHTALRSLNPGLPDAAYDAAVWQITATAASQTLVAANRKQYDLMRDGVPATFHNDKGERVRQRLKVFDFETPTNNDFLCVRELWVRGDLYRRRADIVGFAMVMFTRKVHRKLGGNFTFLVLTDRDDLDSQIYKTFAGCGVVNHDHDPCRASDGRHLSRLLAEHKAYVFSLIQKFNANPSAAYTDRDDIIVVSDEAHRTQYGTLASNMRNALPNASYIGFTGTPLFKDDELTRRVFGKYVSTYDFQRAVEDEATVPLYYDARGDKLRVAVGDLNERIAAKLEELEIDDIDVQQRLEQALAQDYHVIIADQRLDQIARDFVRHYSTAWETGKAMLVCIDKITCVRMHRLIEFYWNEYANELEAELTQTKEEQTEKQIAWMRETRMTVVVSEEQGEVEEFDQWGLDIIPHRRLIKEGMELPTSMRDKPSFRNKQRMDLDDAFKEPEHPFRIAIVCAMWLTGFDVPCLSTLYLDKSLKAHTLMQAIARANRVNEGKNNGLIVDYCGILKHLRQALATFASAEPGGEGHAIDPAKPEEDLLADLAEAIALVRDFLAKGGAPLDDVMGKTGFERNTAIVSAKEVVNENDETRQRFEVMCREVFRKFKACINASGVNDHRTDRDAIDIIYKSLQRDRKQADISDILRTLSEVASEAVTVQPDKAVDRPLYEISRIDFERLKQEFKRSDRRRTDVQRLKDTVEKQLQRMLERNPLRTDFQRHYEEILAAYNREKDRPTIEQTPLRSCSTWFRS